MRILPLHNFEELQMIKQRWSANANGNWLMKHLNHDETEVNELLWERKNYFGEKIGMYFAFIDIYTRMLVWPAVLGVLCYVGDQLYLDGGGWFLIAYSVFVASWSTMLLDVWKRKERELKFAWGVEGLQTQQQQGLAQGQMDSDIQPLFQCSDMCVTKLNEHAEPTYAYRSQVHRYWNLAGSAALIVLYIAAVVFSCTVCVWLRLRGGWWIAIGTVLNLVQILVFEVIFEGWMEAQTRKENHRTKTEHDNALVLKNWVFQFTNNFYMLFYVAFAKHGSVFGSDSYCQDSSGDETSNCMVELQLQLAFIFLSKTVINQIAKSLVPFVKSKFNRHYHNSTRDYRESADCKGGCVSICKTLKDTLCCTWLCSRKDDYVAVVDHTTERRTSEHIDFSVTEQLHRTPYDRGSTHGTFDDFNSLAIQFGFVCLFAPAFPLGALLALINNMVVMRTDSYKLCSGVQRPTVAQCENIGTWLHVFNLLAMVAVATNAVLIAFVSPKVAHALGDGIVGSDIDVDDEYDRFSVGALWAMAVGAEHALLIFKFVMNALVPEEPSWMSRARLLLNVTKKEMSNKAQRGKMEAAKRQMEQDGSILRRGRANSDVVVDTIRTMLEKAVTDRSVMDESSYSYSSPGGGGGGGCQNDPHSPEALLEKVDSIQRRHNGEDEEGRYYMEPEPEPEPADNLFSDEGRDESPDDDEDEDDSMFGGGGGGGGDLDDNYAFDGAFEMSAVDGSAQMSHYSPDGAGKWRDDDDEDEGGFDGGFDDDDDDGGGGGFVNPALAGAGADAMVQAQAQALAAQNQNQGRGRVISGRIDMGDDGGQADLTALSKEFSLDLHLSSRPGGTYMLPGEESSAALPPHDGPMTAERAKAEAEAEVGEKMAAQAKLELEADLAGRIGMDEEKQKEAAEEKMRAEAALFAEQAEREDKAREAAQELLMKESEISAINALLSEHGVAVAVQNGSIGHTTAENKTQYTQIMLFIAQMRALMKADDDGVGNEELMATSSAHKIIKLKDMSFADLEAKKTAMEGQIAEKMRIEYECKTAADEAAAAAENVKHEAEAAEAERMRIEEEAKKKAEVDALVQAKLAHAAATGNLSPSATVRSQSQQGVDSPGSGMLEKKKARAAAEAAEAAKEEAYKAKLAAAGWEMEIEQETCKR